ncbi:hypothetical protein KBY93_11100 [Synechococcus sp. J7-Johnson]|uniref:LamG-like jellyroll fold domain-containing protein n=1 Tax=Synechococcus sp. J7-Johnson TaxID=2823737 RepID=UPI0020CEB99A|nr:LamG-like jellyroll fold domain-containing protein [Synechococcus sp. J7-Johnson]MCP9841174.1 hypothetical protein [Synechococcus sp. J7-Johnson]
MIEHEEALLLHLPCNKAEGDWLADTSPAQTHVPLPGGVEIRPDSDLGRALAFEPGAGRVEVALAKLPEWGLTVAVWIRADAATAARDSVSILQYPLAADTHIAPYCVFGLFLLKGKLHARVGQQHAGLTEKGVTPDHWHHVAVTWDSSTQAAIYYIDGKRVPVSVNGQEAEFANTGIGVLNYPDPNLPLLLGTNTAGLEPFTGRMGEVRLYERALAATELAALVHREKHARSHPFDHHHPLAFRVADDHGHPAVYIVDESSRGRTLHLILQNSSPIAIELPASKAPMDEEVVLVGMNRPTQDDHHLEIVFRPGTLELKDVAHFSAVDTDWHLRGIPNQDGTLSIYLSRSNGLVIPPGGVLTISLAHFKAVALGGSRPTQVELRYRHLNYIRDFTDEQISHPKKRKLSGHRLAHLDVVNQRGRSEAPFTAGFIGSNTVLNDGLTRNALTLYLGNSTLHTLSLAAGELGVRPRLLLSFDSGQLNEADEPWGLGHADEVAEIEITPRELGWVIHERTDSETPEWVILPPDDELQPNTWINFSLYPIVTRSLSGFTNLYLRYQNIGGFRDGEIIVPIEKAPRLYRQQTVPKAKDMAQSHKDRRSVHVFTDSVVVGSGYAVESTDHDPHPPSYPQQNSLSVEGKVGIGTNNPQRSLELFVADGGGIRITGPGGPGTTVALELSTYDPSGWNASATARIQAVDDNYSSAIEFQTKIPGEPSNELVTRMVIDPNGNVKVRGSIEDKNGPVVPIGTIVMWGNYQGSGIPGGWALCDGNDGRPDLRGRFIVGAGEGTYLYTGEKFNFPPPDGKTPIPDSGRIGGTQSVTLSLAELPSHHHRGRTIEGEGSHYHHIPLHTDGKVKWPERSPGNGWQLYNLPEIKDTVPGKTPSTSTTESKHIHTFTTNYVGGSGDHTNMPPFYVLFYIIKVS